MPPYPAFCAPARRDMFAGQALGAVCQKAASRERPFQDAGQQVGLERFAIDLLVAPLPQGSRRFSGA